MAHALMPSIPVACIASVFVLVSVAVYRWSTNNLRHLPGPAHTKITNLRLKWATITGQRMYYIDDLHARYGPIVRVSPTYIAVNSLPAVRQVYTNAGGFDKDKWYSDINPVKDSGTSFNTTSNKAASKRRRLLAPPFSNSSIHANWQLIIRDHAQLAVDQIVTEAKRTGTVNILKWWTLMANDIAARVMFGEQLEQLEHGEQTEYIHNLERLMLAISLAYELPLLSAIGKYLPFRNVFQIIDTHFDMGERVVRNAREGGTKANVFTGLIKTIGDDSKTNPDSIDEFAVAIEASNLLVAASDTTSTVLTYFVWCILSRPSVRRDLEEELATLPPDFTDSDLEKLPILDAVIKETLRMHGGASSALPRQVPAGGAVVDGYALPGGATIANQAYSLHRREDIFPDPLKFDHTRFLRPQTEDQRFAFAAFGRGSRSCIGLHMAWVELRFSAAMFLLAGMKNGGRDRLKLAPSATVESMRQSDFFTTPPVSRKCEVVLES